eukprot:7492858-Pyramimonas_sp.AAC.1
MCIRDSSCVYALPCRARSPSPQAPRPVTHSEFAAPLLCRRHPAAAPLPRGPWHRTAVACRF